MAPQIFIKILYSGPNILIGNVLDDLYPQISITVGIRANKLDEYHHGFCLKAATYFVK